jgi:hypothetical protein
MPSHFWRTTVGWLTEAGLLFGVVMLVPVAILIVGMPVVLLIRALLEIVQRL